MNTNNKNLGNTKKGYALAHNSVYAKEVWNAAIEAAAKECEEWDKGVSPRSDIAPEIRKLKK